jgi:hypothetical protein
MEMKNQINMCIFIVNIMVFIVIKIKLNLESDINNDELL